MDGDSVEKEKLDGVYLGMKRAKAMLVSLEMELARMRPPGHDGALEPAAGLKDRDAAQESPEILFSLMTQAHLGGRAAEGMEYISGAMAFMENRLSEIGKKSESVMELLLTIEETRRKAAGLNDAAGKLRRLRGDAIALSERLSGIEGEMARIDGALAKGSAQTERMEAALRAVSALAGRLEALTQEGDRIGADHGALAAMEERLSTLMARLSDKEKAMLDISAAAESAAARLQSLIALNLHAGKMMDQIRELSRKAADTLEENKGIESRMAAVAPGLQRLESRLETLSGGMAELTAHEKTLADLTRKMETASRSIEGMEIGFASIGSLEERMMALQSQIRELTSAAQQAADDVSMGMELSGVIKSAEARAAGLIDRMESAETRLATTDGLRRTLSMLEEKAFEITRKLDMIEEKGRIAITAQEKIDHLQRLLDQVDAKLSKLFT
jgi:predicted  nucleic acid-binding Zn-ribbon protein